MTRQRDIAKPSPQAPVNTVAAARRSLYIGGVKLAEIEQEAMALPNHDRASLAAKLPGTLPPPGTDVSDEKVELREREMDSGRVTAISHQEFVRRVQEQRGR